MYGRIFWLGVGDSIPTRKVDYCNLTSDGIIGYADGNEIPYKTDRMRLFSVQTYNEMISNGIRIKNTKHPNFSREDAFPSWGDMGEHITIDGMDFKKVRVGQVFALGKAAIKITGPSCVSETVYDIFGKELRRFLYEKRGNSGFCAEVIGEGKLTMSDAIELIELVQPV